jgi:hypothetical protein
MLRKALVLIVAASLSMGAAQAKPKAAAPKPTPAAKPPAAASRSQAPFDARDPAGLIAVLTAMGAKAAVVEADPADDAVRLKVTSPAGAFAVQFAGCAHRRACQALQFDAGSEGRTATLADINAFNQGSLACRLYQDKATGRPHVLYSALLFATHTREDLHTQMGAWLGCVASFGDFLKDPPGYLASAP